MSGGDFRFLSKNCLDVGDCLAPTDCTCYLLMTPELDAELRARAAAVSDTDRDTEGAK